MSSNLQAHSGVDTTQLQKEIQGDHQLHHITPPNENLPHLKDQVIQQAAQEGKGFSSHLHHVQAPPDGLSQEMKEAWLRDHQASKQNKGDDKNRDTGRQFGGGQCCGQCGQCKDGCKCTSSCQRL